MRRRGSSVSSEATEYQAGIPPPDTFGSKVFENNTLGLYLRVQIFLLNDEVPFCFFSYFYFMGLEVTSTPALFHLFLVV